MKNLKGFATIAAVIVAILVIGGVLYIGQTRKNALVTQISNPPTSSKSVVVTHTPNIYNNHYPPGGPGGDDTPAGLYFTATGGLITYAINAYNISFQYPAGWWEFPETGAKQDELLHSVVLEGASSASTQPSFFDTVVHFSVMQNASGNSTAPLENFKNKLLGQTADNCKKQNATLKQFLGNNVPSSPCPTMSDFTTERGEHGLFVNGPSSERNIYFADNQRVYVFQSYLPPKGNEDTFVQIAKTFRFLK